ncbi:AfsR/SARP family transcriptional regulator [Streptomyces sp. DSM 40750]|uniref:AfsR/SARP family transcriptional regulator n=1 Tax=Streptomyces sp. DSM 40750 TaxID=2801030 RepID=UPI00214CB336|nr:BTAD domain-containing putative transcriptional regulator [Streptomyces sp. DSM 40750]UUU22870.1 winged helix-turn-helix domain-containing protein [Streptomyces sp. DSM 40750]
MEGKEIPLNGTKQRTMLAALLLADERVLPDFQLGEALWGKRPPGTYQAQIYTYASRLRQHLENHAEIIRKGSGYMLRITSGRFDYGDFTALSYSGRSALREGRYQRASELLRAALGLWRGPTLTDVTEHLWDTERPSIEEAYMETLESRISANLALGQHAQLTSELVGLVHAHPLRERLRAQLMLALYASDRQADAFTVFHEGRQLLDEELGVDPGSALRRTYQAILTTSVDAMEREVLVGLPERDPIGDDSPLRPESFLAVNGIGHP